MSNDSNGQIRTDCEGVKSWKLVSLRQSQHVARLRRCCQLEVLQDHYSRFGADVRTCGMMRFNQLVMQDFGKVFQFFGGVIMCNLDWFPSIAIAVAWSRCEMMWVPILKPTRTALCTSWIRECPETSAKALCESLIMAIECARVTCYDVSWPGLSWHLSLQKW